MEEPRNVLKSRLMAARPSLGLWCSLASAYTTEIMAGAGAGWLLIDGEHSPNDLRAVLAQLQACGGYPVEPVVRLPSDEPSLVKRYKDIGARSLMIPNVRDAEQAGRIAAVARYAPKGIRGFSAAQRANRFGRVADYHAKADEQAFLAVQIECEAGVANAAGIAGVEGVDALFVGPGDLSANMGEMGRPDAPAVQRAIASVLAAATEAGKPAGILAPVKADADRYLSDGFTMVAVGSDLGLLARGSDALVASFG